MSQTDSPPDAVVHEGDPGSETVAVYVDLENISGGSSLTFSSGALDYGVLLDTLVNGRTLKHANAYMAMPETASPKDAFAAALDRLGYEIVSVPISRAEDGTTRGDADIAITLDIMDMLHTATPETVILCTGDSDFLPVVTRLQHAGITVEVASFPVSLSDDLSTAADVVHRLDDAETFELDG